MTTEQSEVWRDTDETGKVRMRFDFEFKPIRTDDATMTATLSVQPDRRRYTVVEVQGESHYFDRFLKTTIPKSVVDQMIKAQVVGMPITYSPPTIESSLKYALVRQDAILSELQGEKYAAPPEKARQHSVLAFDKDKRFLSFLSVDICGSSGLRRLNASSFERAYEIFIRELATSVGHFHGSILKATGDGFIAFIDGESYTTQCDNTVDLGLTFLEVLRVSINPALEAAGLTPLKIRVGADCGNAQLRKIYVPATGFQSPELASDALNRAVKIEQSASENELRIGRGLYELVHVQWLERCEEVDFNGREVGITGYQVYKVV